MPGPDVVLDVRVADALRLLAEIADGLAGRAHENAWWPYRGTSAEPSSKTQPTASPSLAVGESGALDNYRMATGHLQRCEVALIACAAGERWRWAKAKVLLDDVAGVERSPAALVRTARWCLRELVDLRPAIADPEVTRDVLAQLGEACTQAGLAHARLLRAAPHPPTGGRGTRRSPTRPARRGGQR